MSNILCGFGGDGHEEESLLGFILHLEILRNPPRHLGGGREIEWLFYFDDIQVKNNNRQN